MKRLVWTINRWFLMRGQTLWVALLGSGVLLLLVAMLLLSLVRLEQTARALQQHPAVSAVSANAAASEGPEPTPFPTMDERFNKTRQILAVLSRSGLQPAQIKFKYERSEDAALFRQIADFSVVASWKDVGEMLKRLQATDRAVYISRLRLARESTGHEAITAEIQLAVVFVDRDQESSR